MSDDTMPVNETAAVHSPVDDAHVSRNALRGGHADFESFKRGLEAVRSDPKVMGLIEDILERDKAILDRLAE